MKGIKKILAEKEKKYTFADRNKIKHRKNEKNVSAIQKKKKK